MDYKSTFSNIGITNPDEQILTIFDGFGPLVTNPDERMDGMLFFISGLIFNELYELYITNSDEIFPLNAGPDDRMEINYG